MPRFEIEGCGDSEVTYWLSPGLGRGRPGFDTRLNLHKGATKGLKKLRRKCYFCSYIYKWLFKIF